jgi:hypothetical protein
VAGGEFDALVPKFDTPEEEIDIPVPKSKFAVEAGARVSVFPGRPKTQRPFTARPFTLVLEWTVDVAILGPDRLCYEARSRSYTHTHTHTHTHTISLFLSRVISSYDFI